MIKTKKDRLHEVYEHLRAYHGVHTQNELAAIIGITKSAMSAAMNGNEKYLTNNLFKKICAAYQGEFDLDYLLSGEGELLATDFGKSTPPPSVQQSVIDPSSMVNAIIAANNSAIATKDELISAKEEMIEGLKRELRGKDKLINANEETITSLKRELRDKDELIISLRQQLLQLQQLQRQQSTLPPYFNPTGVADDKKV
jgi:transcriptional regulator with XRE-family HTH domain